MYNCNLTNKKGQTENFKIHDYVKSINTFFKKDRIDYVIVPIRKPVYALIHKYEKREGVGSVVDFNDIVKEEKSYQVVKASVLNRTSIKSSASDAGSFIRHDSDRLAKTIIEIMEMDEGKMIKKII